MQIELVNNFIVFLLTLKMSVEFTKIIFLSSVEVSVRQNPYVQTNHLLQDNKVLRLLICKGWSRNLLPGDPTGVNKVMGCRCSFSYFMKTCKTPRFVPLTNQKLWEDRKNLSYPALYAKTPPKNKKTPRFLFDLSPL